MRRSDWFKYPWVMKRHVSFTVFFYGYAKSGVIQKAPLLKLSLMLLLSKMARKISLKIPEGGLHYYVCEWGISHTMPFDVWEFLHFIHKLKTKNQFMVGLDLVIGS